MRSAAYFIFLMGLVMTLGSFTVNGFAKELPRGAFPRKLAHHKGKNNGTANLLGRPLSDGSVGDDKGELSHGTDTGNVHGEDERGNKDSDGTAVEDDDVLPSGAKKNGDHEGFKHVQDDTGEGHQDDNEDDDKDDGGEDGDHSNGAKDKHDSPSKEDNYRKEGEGDDVQHGDHDYDGDDDNNCEDDDEDEDNHEKCFHEHHSHYNFDDNKTDTFNPKGPK